MLEFYYSFSFPVFLLLRRRNYSSIFVATLSKIRNLSVLSPIFSPKDDCALWKFCRPFPFGLSRGWTGHLTRYWQIFNAITAANTQKFCSIWYKTQLTLFVSALLDDGTDELRCSKNNRPRLTRTSFSFSHHGGIKQLCWWNDEEGNQLIFVMAHMSR